jgi:hypothetical protein
MEYKNNKFSLNQNITARIANIVKKINIKQLMFTTNGLIYSQMYTNEDKYFFVDIFDLNTYVYVYKKNILTDVKEIKIGSE